MRPDPRLTALDLDSLVGRPVEQVQALVRGAGGVTRTVAPGDIVTAEFRPNRVTIVAADGVVVAPPTIG